MSTRRSSATDPGASLVVSLAEREFDQLADTLAPDVHMRALIPPGPIDVLGAELVAAKFASWLGRFEEIDLVHSDIHHVGDRLHVSYQLRAREPDHSWKIIEQHMFCVLGDSGVASLDLLCSGFRPFEPASLDLSSGFASRS